jgi:hypothetical protein
MKQKYNHRQSNRKDASDMEPPATRDEFGRPLTIGVYGLVNTVTGRMLVGSGVNLRSQFNRMRTELRLGVYRHRPLQDDWQQYGEEAFRFDILEEYLPQEKEGFFEIFTSLQALEEKWAQKLQRRPQYTRIT